MTDHPDALAGTPPIAWLHLSWSNFYSARHALHLITTPKVACTSLKWWFVALEGLEQAVRQAPSIETLPELVVHDGLLHATPNRVGRTPEQFESLCARTDLFRFAFVRHPAARVFSAWASKVVLAEPAQAEQLAPQYLHPNLADREQIRSAFEQFVTEVVAAEADRCTWSDPHWAPQTLLLQPQRLHYSGGIWPIERLDAFRSALANWVDRRGTGPIDFALGRYNESPLPYSAQWITPTAHALIQRHYADDYAQFGYTPDELPPGQNPDHLQLESIWCKVQTIRARNVQFTALRRRYLDAAEQMAALSALHQQIQAELSAKNALIQSQEQAMQALLKSRSWRLTAPLRWASARLRPPRSKA